MNRDEEHLRLLAIFHFILSGLMALCAMIPFIHVAVGLFLILDPAAFGSPGQEPPPPWLGYFFVAFASVFIVLGLSLAALMLFGGLSLAKRRRYVFCQVIACLECLMMPLGTVLGVFTLVVLSRPSVRDLFNGVPPAPVKPGNVL
jgi:hypothetical protein